MATKMLANAFERQRERDAARRRAARAFATSVHSGDADATFAAFQVLTQSYSAGLWRMAMRAVAKAPCPSRALRRRLLDMYVAWGDNLRQEVSDDLLLCDALRMMLLPYAGPARVLYRGEIGENQRRRTYSLSWSQDIDVARHFAQGITRTCIGGSVLLKTTAPPSAIICAPSNAADRYGEREFLVDRRRLHKVEVVERFSQISHAEYDEQSRAHTRAILIERGLGGDDDE